jgi:hypothetical protein
VQPWREARAVFVPITPAESVAAIAGVVVPASVCSAVAVAVAVVAAIVANESAAVTGVATMLVAVGILMLF